MVSLYIFSLILGGGFLAMSVLGDLFGSHGDVDLHGDMSGFDGHLGSRDPALGRRCDDLVLDIGDVGDVLHVVAPPRQVPADDIECDRLAAMACVGSRLNGGTAHIDGDFSGHPGLEILHPSAERVVDPHWTRMVSAGITLPLMLKPLNRPWVIAHRGASHALRENTVAAFHEAFARGADAAELDVRRTADATLVVHHDAVIPDVGPIIAMDRDDIEEAAPWIPDLETGIAACAGMWVNVEIKNSPADPDWDESHVIARQTVAVLQEIDVADRVLVSSFNPETIRVAADSLPGIKTGWISDVGTDPLQATRLAAEAGHNAIHPHVDTMDESAARAVVQAAYKAGLLVIVWTVDDAAEMMRLAEAGVDGIITNVPTRARSAFENGNGDGG